MGWLLSTILIALAIGWTPVHAASWAGKLSCQACTISCRFAQCYRIVGDGYDQQVCGDADCSIAKEFPITFGNCSYDLYGDACPTGVCLALPSTNECASTYFPQLSCTSGGYNYEISYSECNHTLMGNCFSCRIQNVVASASYQQSCLGATCHDVQYIKMLISACAASKDQSGNACSCCYTVLNSPANSLFLCSNKYSIYSDADFNRFLKAKTSSNWGQTLSMMGIVLMALVLG